MLPYIRRAGSVRVIQFAVLACVGLVGLFLLGPTPFVAVLFNPFCDIWR
jgi:hypothetical protein